MMRRMNYVAQKVTTRSTTYAIVYVAPKNKMISHHMILNSRISCVVVISIFGFDKY